MKTWDVVMSVELGDTKLSTVVQVRAPDRYDAVQAAIAAMVTGTRISTVVEAK